jgi:integrase
MNTANLVRIVAEDYTLKGQNVRQLLAQAKPLLEGLSEVSQWGVDAYVRKRVLYKKRARATVNRELSIVRRGLRLARRKGMEIPEVHIELLPENNARQGFVSPDEVRALIKAIGPQLVKDIVRFLFGLGWRSGEVFGLAWSEVEGHRISLPQQRTKNRAGKAIELPEALQHVLARRRALRARQGPLSPWVFHRNGKRVKSIRRAFKAGAARIGRPELIPHDLRRSAVKAMIERGYDEGTVMAVVGMKTPSILRRYHIADSRRMSECLEEHAI